MEKTIIFSDGSSRGNPGPGGFGAIIFRDEKVFELGGREDRTTNNRMEIMGAISALEKTKDGEVIDFHTDSKYLIDAITKWIFGWQKNGWKKKDGADVLNQDLWERLIEVVKGRKIKWLYASGHSGIPGNERCDEIATSFADNIKIDLFNGDRKDYKIDLSKLESGGVNVGKTKSSNKKAFSYLSVVDGKLEKHFSWAECEKRVKGVKSARYKKSKDAEDEKNIMKDWGF